MELTTVWFVLIAVLWIGYFVLEGFDFGVGMLLPVLGRGRHRAPRHDQHDRPGLGRQRGLGARRRRRHVRGVPRVVRDAVQRLLPAAAADPARADRARARVRVPAQARPRPRWQRAVGPGDHRRLGRARRCCGASPSPTSCAACRSTPTRSSPARCSPCSTRTALLGGLVTLLLFLTHGAMFVALKTDGEIRHRARALAVRLGRRGRGRRGRRSWSGRRPDAATAGLRGPVRGRRAVPWSAGCSRAGPGREGWAFVGTFATHRARRGRAVRRAVPRRDAVDAPTRRTA